MRGNLLLVDERRKKSRKSLFVTEIARIFHSSGSEGYEVRLGLAGLARHHCHYGAAAKTNGVFTNIEWKLRVLGHRSVVPHEGKTGGVSGY
jgi:hypothetical protein